MFIKTSSCLSANSVSVDAKSRRSALSFQDAHYYKQTNYYKVDVGYGNPLNLNGTTVGHLDMNSHEYTVEVGYVNPRNPIAIICQAIRHCSLFQWLIMKVTKPIRIPMLSIHFPIKFSIFIVVFVLL
jgi:hypothetical protein